MKKVVNFNINVNSLNLPYLLVNMFVELKNAYVRIDSIPKIYISGQEN